MTLLEPFGLMEKALYDIGEHDLLDVWDLDLTDPDPSLSCSSPPPSSWNAPPPPQPQPPSIQQQQPLLAQSHASTAPTPCPRSTPSSLRAVIRDDRLLTDCAMFSASTPPGPNASACADRLARAEHHQAAADCGQAPVKMEHSYSVLRAIGASNAFASSAAAAMAPSVGSDGDSIADSPISIHEEMESDCFPYIPLGSEAEAYPVGDAVKSEPLSPGSGQSLAAIGDDTDEDDDDDTDDDDDDVDVVGKRSEQIASSTNDRKCAVSGGGGTASTKDLVFSTANVGYVIKQEPGTQLKLCPAQSLLKQPTIVLAAKTGPAGKIVFPKVNVKLNSQSGFASPLTPPLSNCSSSDSESCVVVSSSVSVSKAGKSGSSTRLRMPHTRQPINTPLISSQPKGASGPLFLTEEEKRTLLLEGYPVPQKLPLSKQEEKSLKKIRRKIKNKISAQESRRKKKEYMDCLERKMNSIHSELSEYKSRCSSLEEQNASLVAQIKRLQAQLHTAAKTGVLTAAAAASPAAPLHAVRRIETRQIVTSIGRGGVKLC